MKISILIEFLFCSIPFACKTKNNDRFIFCLSNQLLETHELNEPYPEFGRTEYKEIILEFKNGKLKVNSEKRNGNVDAIEYGFGIIN